ncbi:PAS domain S-box protein [Mucilaginibacter sp. BJC16-A38]|uniref:PAS domain S-box protein n=1 Tax=Mucilaginibacter phenanthrenivorans TaxID=1234842 RepID=UPI0021589CC9|nr:PAS domain S-box protein [Mucilaginibacter phenanthrenivorans]MCR8557798.1 PAS domain S-box protein [Mucilaginibacter phenanthrenivorans]
MSEYIHKNLIEMGFDVAEHTNAMLAYWDRNLVCKFANNAYKTWFGVSPEEMIDKMNIRQLLGPLYEKNLVYIDAALKGKTQVFNRTITLPSGEIRNSRASYFPDYNGGTVVGFYVHVADISPLHSGNQSNRNSQSDEPEDFLRVQNKFLDGVLETLKASLLTGFPGITRLAKMHFVSESKLKRDFKEEFDLTVFAYFRNLQMELAHNYFTKKKCNKSQMALMLNFSNPSNFSACYKKFVKENAEKNKILEIQKENDERYRTFIEQCPMAIAMLDNELRFLAISQKWITEFDLREKNLIGQHAYDLLPGFESKYDEMLKWCLADNIKSNREDFIVMEDGTHAWMKWDVRPWYQRNKEVGGLIVLAENITELKNKEDENKKISIILNKTSELARIGVWKKNFKVNTGIWSKVLKEILEVPDSFDPGVNLALNFYKEGDSRNRAKKMLKNALEDGDEFDFEAEIITAKGNLKRVRVIGYPEMYNGKCEKISGILQDITDYFHISKSSTS